MQRRKITQSQKKIIIISLIVGSLFLVFLFFIYFPSKNIVMKIKSELFNKEKQIQDIETTIGKDKTLEKGIELLQVSRRRLNNKFPPKEEGGLEMLSDFAKKLNIEFISIEPKPKQAFLDENGSKVELEGKSCQGVLVAIEIKCLYKELVKYIQLLKESLPAFVTIETLRVNKDKSGMPKLNVILNLNLYILA